MSSAPYAPWWLGAVSLAVVTVGSCVVARRPLGVSGIIGRFADLRAELEAERRRRAMARDEAALEAALLAATAEAFGVAPPGQDAAAPPCGSAGAYPETGPTPRGAAWAGCVDCGAAEMRPSLAAHAVFLGAVVLGGLAMQLARGSWSVSFDMGATFAALFGGGGRATAVLGFGGVLVGLGTTISGGCSTGHGLSGCSRLQPAGIAATVTFFTAAVLVSLALRRGLS